MDLTKILYPSIQIGIGSSVGWDDGILNLTSIASHPYQIIGAVDGTRTNISSFTVKFLKHKDRWLTTIDHAIKVNDKFSLRLFIVSRNAFVQNDRTEGF